jgi:heat shock protein HtpX
MRLDPGAWRQNLAYVRLRTLLPLLGMTVLALACAAMVVQVAGLPTVLALGAAALVSVSWRFPADGFAEIHARPLTRAAAPALFAELEALARRAGLAQVPRLFSVPVGGIDALAIGDRRDPAILLSDGMLRFYGVRELSFVLAHEIGHLRGRDAELMRLADALWRLTIVLGLAGAVLLVLEVPIGLLRDDLLPWQFVFRLDLLLPLYAGTTWLLVPALVMAPYLCSALALVLARAREVNADLTAARLTDDPLGLAASLRKVEHYERWLLARLGTEDEAEEPERHSTHPRLAARVARLQALAPAPEPVPLPVR